MSMTDNARAVIGSNTPDAIDYALEESIRLQEDYAELAKTAEALEAEADAIPDVIPDAATKEIVVDLIKRIRDAKVRIDGLHDLEKQPHLRRGQGVDQFFFGLWDRLLKRAKNNRDGIGDSLLARLTAYDVRVLAEENARRARAGRSPRREPERRRPSGEPIASPQSRHGCSSPASKAGPKARRRTGRRPDRGEGGAVFPGREVRQSGPWHPGFA